MQTQTWTTGVTTIALLVLRTGELKTYIVRFWKKRNINEISIFTLLNLVLCHIQYNLNGLNPDDSNSFFSPYKILPIAQEIEYLGIFSYFIMELYVVCTH